MASPNGILAAYKAMPGAASLTMAPQGSGGPYFGQFSPLAQQLANESGYARAYGPGFLPRQPPVFTQGAFGPFSPILPVGVDQPASGADLPDPRLFQYQVGWNLPVGQPGQEGTKLADFGTLKTLADLYCLMPETRVLCSDLTWRPLSEVTVGDTLLGFDEEPAVRGAHRKLRPSAVESCDRIIRPCYRIRLTDGREIVASAEHRWFAARYTSGRGQSGLLPCPDCARTVADRRALGVHRRQAHDVVGSNDPAWIMTSDLRPGTRIKDLGIPWDRDESRGAGYLAAAFDGEGSVSSRARGSGFGIQFAQKPGLVLDEVEMLLKERGYRYKTGTQGSSGVRIITVRGIYDCLRLLGECGPLRLVAKAMTWLDGRSPFARDGAGSATVEAAEFLGDREVVAVGTSTKTLFAEGLFSHNSVARACIELRKNEITGLDWDIIPTRDAAKAYNGSQRAMRDFGARRGEVLKFFGKPDPDYNSFRTFLTAALEEVFVFDALSLLIRPKRGKGLKRGILGSDLDCLELISGPTMRPLLGMHGEIPRPPNPAYQQYLYGVPRSDYMTMITQRDIDEGGLTEAQINSWTTDQFLYLPLVPRRWTPYGFPPVERALIPVMSGLQKQAFQLDYFKEGCFDTKTDILTQSGWKPFADLTDGDQVATRSADGYFEWQTPSARPVYDYDGDMIAWQNRYTDQVVTPGHRMLVRSYRDKGDWHIRLAKHLAENPSAEWEFPVTALPVAQPPAADFVLPRAGGKAGNRRGDFRMPMTDFCAFVGTYLSEGYVADRIIKSSGYHHVKIEIAQSEKSERLPEIERILKATGITWHYRSSRFYATFAGLGRWLKDNCGHGCENKRIPTWMLQLPAECLEALLNGLMLGDGTYGPLGQRYYSTTSRQLADDVQQIFAMLGRDASLQTYGLTTGGKRHYRVAERIQGDGAHLLPKPEHVEYHGKVYCVTVPNGVILVRRNGQYAYSGNTIPAVYISPGDVNMTPNQIRELQDALNAFAGDPAWHHKVIVLPPGSKVDPQKPVDVADQFDDVVMTQVCQAFDVNPMELGILPKVAATASPSQVKQMAQGAASVHERLSTKPLLKYLADIFDSILHNVLHQDDMKFTFEGLQEDAEQGMLTDLLIQQVQSGIRSVDEARDQLELQPWGLPMTSGPVIFTAAGVMPFDMPPLPATAGQAQGGAQSATRRAPTAGPAPLQQAGRQGGEPAPTPGHAAAAAANATSRSGRAPSVSAPATGAVSAAKMVIPAAVTSELGALVRHLNKGRRITTWRNIHIPAHAMAIISEDLAKGLSPEQAADVVKPVILGPESYEWIPKAGAPEWSIPDRFRPRVEQAFEAAIAEISQLIQDWWSGQVVLTRSSLVDQMRAVIAAALEPVLQELWAESWRANDETAGGYYEAWEASHGRDNLEQISGSRLRKVSQAISDAVQSGRGPDQVIGQLAGLLDVMNRAEMIAVTETGRAAGAAAITRYRSQGTTYKEWWTANDGRVCFPAGTPVLTPSGDVPIERLGVGDVAVTPQGQRRITAVVSRPFAGTLAVITAEGRTVTATGDHPFMTASGWRKAADVQTGDLLESPGDQVSEVSGVVHLTFVQPDHAPAASGQVSVSACVPAQGGRVPVGAVGLNIDAVRNAGEVQGPWADLMLLEHVQADPGQGFADPCFQGGFASEAAVAAARAEPPRVRQAGHGTELGAAVPAGQQHGRTAAFLGAEVPIQGLLGAESLAASLAVHVDGPASSGAAAVTAGGAGGYGELAAALGADLGDPAPAGVVTSPGAEALELVFIPAGAEGQTALRTPSLLVDDCGGVVAVPRAENACQRDTLEPHEFFAAAGALVSERHQSSARIVSSEPVIVYDITVADEHVFYANGFLVHNCGECRKAQDEGPIPLDSLFSNGLLAPGAHPRCVLGSTRVTARGVMPADITQRLAYDLTASRPGHGGDSRLAATSAVAVAERDFGRGNIRAVTDRDYVGDIVTIRTARGYELSVTPNHPVATGGGWVQAAELAVGSYVLCSTAPEWVPGAVDPDVDHVPPRIEQVAETLPVLFGAVPVAAEDFHGDGQGSEVCVVRADRLLVPDGEALLAQHAGEHDLRRRHVPAVRAPALDAQGPGDQELLGLGYAPDAVVGGLGERCAVCGAGLSHAGVHGGAAVADLDASGFQPAADDVAADSGGFCERLLALSGEITLDEVIDVQRDVVATHVYNLDTVDGWYIGNGIVTHNCRCTLVPSVTHGVMLKSDGDSIHPGERDAVCGRGHTHHGEFGAAGLLIRHKGDDGKTRYLLQKRSVTEDDPGTWSVPGGALLPGETPAAGAFREAQEEMGPLPPAVTEHHHVVDDHGDDWAFTTIVCDTPEMFMPDMAHAETPEESSGFGWFTRDEIAGLPLHPGFRDAWEAVIRTRKNTDLGKCVMRRVNLDGQEFWSAPDPCPCHSGDLAAGGGGPEFMPHDADGIQDGRAPGSRGGGTAGHNDDGGLVHPAPPSPEWEDDGEYPQSRGVPPHQGGLLQGYQGGYWPQGGHGTAQPGVSAPGRAAARGIGKKATLSKADAGYRPSAGETESCGACTMIRAAGSGSHACTLVKGDISPQYVCDHFDPQPAFKHDHGKADAVHAQLEGNFPDDAITWVMEGHWEGPLSIPLDQVDFADHKEWAAWHEQSHVDDFKRAIQAGEHVNPPVLIRTPSKKDLIIIDGHHRCLAYRELGLPITGWAGDLPDELKEKALETHSSQHSQGSSGGND